jgi:hypothetical protein
VHAKINLPAIADHSAAAPTRLAAASRGLSFRPLPSFFAPFKSGIGYTYVFGRRSDGDTNNNPVPGLNESLVIVLRTLSRGSGRQLYAASYVLDTRVVSAHEKLRPHRRREVAPFFVFFTAINLFKKVCTESRFKLIIGTPSLFSEFAHGGKRRETSTAMRPACMQIFCPQGEPS